mmetsp:Transcript_34002/g.72295  ORF Transcript_34002/g.72295 Transcript_34002/m.72295 type:complete len:250 (+) Transcript_34002:1950-2699(+)
MLHLERLPRHAERVSLHLHWVRLRLADLLVIHARELVAVCDKDRLAINHQLAPNLQALRLKVAAVGRRETVAADQLSLRDATVVLARLNDMASIVLEVIQDGHIPHPVVLKVGFHDGLLEVPLESQHMSVKGVPSRQFALLVHETGALKDCSGGAVRQGARSPLLRRPRGLDELRLLVRKPFLDLNALLVHNVPGLRLVVPLLELGEGEARKVGQRLQVNRSHLGNAKSPEKRRPEAVDSTACRQWRSC